MSEHKRIFLQVDGDAFGEWEGTTWAQDQINDTDVEYVLASELTRQEAVVAAARDYVKHKPNDVQPARYRARIELEDALTEYAKSEEAR